jgi:hypothetical protein
MGRAILNQPLRRLASNGGVFYFLLEDWRSAIVPG